MKRIIMIYLLGFGVLILNAQPRPGVTENDYNLLKNAVNTIFGINKYEVGGLINIDSCVGKKWITAKNVEDPYHTLAQCYVFTAEGITQDNDSPRPKGFIGVFKNGQILWRSDIIVNEALGSCGYFDISDINRDGKVELSTSWCEGNQSDFRHLWIFGWDGSTGTLLNDVDSTGRSILSYLGESLDIIDINGDGIKELQGVWDPDNSGNDVTVIYSWNGYKYGNYTISPPPSGVSNPRNKVDVDVKSQVKKNGKYEYSYTLINKNTSLQNIENFFIQRFSDSISNISSRSNWRGDLFKMPTGIMWTNLFTSDNYIIPGELDSSFKYLTSSLPIIVTSYIQGNNGENGYDEIISNSFHVKTIGPADSPNPFIPLNFLDTLSSYTTQSRSLGWIKDQPTANKYLGYFASAKTSLGQNNITSTSITLQQVLRDSNIDSTSLLTSEAYALIRYNTEYLLAQLPTAPPPGLNVKLINSDGTKLTGGTLQYYEGSWKDVVNNNDGTFFINTTKTTLSLRMTYEYGTQTKSNVTVGYDTAAFQTVNAQIQLQNSSGNFIDIGSVQYYAGAWRNLGNTINGIATKELLPANYSFRMSYAYASKDKQQDISTNATVVFQTVNATIQLKNSLGNLIPAPLGDQATVQYYSGAWRDFGTTTNGVANKELLPNNYSFRMSYAYASKDKQQDISTNPTVIFQTVNAAVQLQNSQGSLIDQGTVQYYSGAWRTFGTTTNGVAAKELLPNNYSFRMTYAFASKDKQQDIGINPTVIFQTVNANVQLQNSQGNLIEQATVQYYSGAWRDFGTTTNGVANKELLPNNYSFRMTYEYVSIDKSQDLSVNNTVGFSTVLCTIRVKNSQTQLVNNAMTSYYSGAWRVIGNTMNGEVTKELLPVNLSFRAKYGTKQQDKTQNLSTNNVVEFSLP
jgi:hypothetical protein